MKKAKKKSHLLTSESKSTRHAVTPGRHIAQVDIDRKSDLALFKRHFFVLNARMKLYRESAGDVFAISIPVFTRSDIRRSSNHGNHWHVEVISSQGLNKAERIALQAALGSDRKRELLSLCRYFAGSRYPTLFFEERKCKSS